jgi:DNA-binding response OmpR family regulator
MRQRYGACAAVRASGTQRFTAQDTASVLRLAETCEAELLISDIGLPDEPDTS